MTPHDVALHMMRQRHSTVSDPAFIVAYLEAELAAATPTAAVEAALIRRLEQVMAAVEAFARAGFAASTSMLSIDITKGRVTLRA